MRITAIGFLICSMVLYGVVFWGRRTSRPSRFMDSVAFEMYSDFITKIDSRWMAAWTTPNGSGSGVPDSVKEETEVYSKGKADSDSDSARLPGASSMVAFPQLHCWSAWTSPKPKKMRSGLHLALSEIFPANTPVDGQPKCLNSQQDSNASRPFVLSRTWPREGHVRIFYQFDWSQKIAKITRCVKKALRKASFGLLVLLIGHDHLIVGALQEIVREKAPSHHVHHVRPCELQSKRCHEVLRVRCGPYRPTFRSI